MSDNVDNRVVQMQFDNKQFESGIDTSLKSIDQLKKGLDFKDAEKSLDGLAASGKSFSLDKLADGVQGIAGKFSALSIMGITALQNITNAAINLGQQLIASLGEPIKAGLDQYETVINSVQTILANTSMKGTTLDNVNAALKDMIVYSNKTIYNFTDMARNLGTFTAAGLSLETSATAIKGIANLAALSGSNSQQAAMAMYQLSQALSSGTLKLQDWNSVVNAGMGGQIFQNSLMETARVHGVAIDEMLKKEGSFRQTLEKGWLSSDILAETLSKFTGDLTAKQLVSMGYTDDQAASILKMSTVANDAATKVKTLSQLTETLEESAQAGWGQTWQILLGDFEEAKSLFTNISDILGGMLGDSNDLRNKLLQTWKNLGGRQVIVEGLQVAFQNLLDLAKPIQEAFANIFPPITGKQLYELTLAVYNLIEKFKVGTDASDKIKRVFEGLFALIDIGKMAVLALAKALSGLDGPLGDGASNLLDFLAKGGDWIVNLRNQIKSTDAFGKALDKMKQFLQDTGVKIKTFVDNVKTSFDKFKAFLDDVKKKIQPFVDKFKEGFGSISHMDFSGLTGFLDKIKDRLAPLGNVGELIGKMFSIAGKALLIFNTLVIKALPFVLGLANKAADGISGFLDAMVKNVEGFDFNRFFDALNAGLLTALLLGVKKFIDNGGSFFDKIATALGDGEGFLGKITGIFDGVRESLEAYQNNLKSGMLLKIAAAIGILAISLVAISMIDSKRLTAALAAMTVMFIQLGTSLAVLEKMTQGSELEQLGTVTIGLLGLATSILILSGAVATLGKLKTSELGRGLFAVGLLITMITTSSVVLSKSAEDLIPTAIALLILAGALTVLTGAVERLAKLDAGKLTAGLIGIAVLCTELVLFMKSSNMDSMGITKSVGILILAGALNVLALAVEKMAKLDAGGLLRGLLAIGAVLAEVSIFVNSTSNTAQLITTAVSLTILGAALLILTESVTKLGNMTWDQIAKGLTSLAGALAIIAVATTLMPKDLMLTALSLVVVSTSLVILAGALTTLGNMTWEEIARGLVALGGALIVLSTGLGLMSGTLSGTAALILAALALALLAPPLKLLGSMDLSQIGASLLVLVGVFTVFGVASLLLVEALPVMLGLAAALFLIGLAGLALGVGVAALGAGLFFVAAAVTALAIAGAAGVTGLLYVIVGVAGLIPMLINVLGKALLGLLQVIVDGLPLILKALEILLLGLVDILVKVAPPLAKATWELVNSLLKTIAANLPSIIESGVSIIMSLLKGIDDNIDKITIKAYDIMIKFLAALDTKIPDLVEAGYQFIIALINGLTSAIDKHMPELMVAVTNLAVAIVKGLIQGYFDSSASIRQAMWDIAMMTINAIKQALGIHSPSTEFIAIGVMTIQGLIAGILSMATALTTQFVTMVANSLLIFTQAGPRFLSAGIALINWLITGMVNIKNSVIAKAQDILDSTLAMINGKYAQLQAAGTNLINGLGAGVTAAKNMIIGKGQDLLESFRSAIAQKISQFVDLGHSVVEGFQNGIGDYIYKAVAAANDLASAVLDAIRSVLDINSPSGETEDAAYYTVQGLVGGLVRYTNMAVDAAKSLGTKTLNGLTSVLSTISDSVDTNLNSEPVIRPVLDLTNIEKGGSQLTNMLGTKGIDVTSSLGKATTISTGLNTSVSTDTSTPTQPASSAPINIQYNQTNNSPKALSAPEIYRQTKNQLTSLKKQVGAL